MRANSSRPGMTMFALLLILSVLGMLSAMLFPVLLKVRQAALRTRCGSNQRQMVIAMHNWANANNGNFPGPGKGKNDSWCYELLPYVESDPSLVDVTKVPVNLFYSPGRRKPDLYNKLPHSDYAGCTGTSDDPTKPGEKKEWGVFHPDGVTLQQITNADGTAFTIAIGPKYLKTTEYLTGKGKGDSETSWNGGSVDTLRSCNGEKRPFRRDDDKEDNERGFGSWSEATCPFAFCDGSVRNLSYKIKPKTFAALCTYAGEEEVDPNDK